MANTGRLPSMVWNSWGSDIFPNGANHLSVSHIYHELAKLYDEGLGEQKMALMKSNFTTRRQDCIYLVPIGSLECALKTKMNTKAKAKTKIKMTTLIIKVQLLKISKKMMMKNSKNGMRQIQCKS